MPSQVNVATVAVFLVPVFNIDLRKYLRLGHTVDHFAILGVCFSFAFAVSHRLWQGTYLSRKYFYEDGT